MERFLVSVLYHEARHRKVPMTRLTNQLLREALANCAGWQRMVEPTFHGELFRATRGQEPGRLFEARRQQDKLLAAEVC